MNSKTIILDALASATGPMNLGEIFKQNPTVSEDEIRAAAWSLAANHEITVGSDWGLSVAKKSTLLQELEEAKLQGFKQRQQLVAEKNEADRQKDLELAKDTINKLPTRMKNRAVEVGKNGGKLEVTALHHLESTHPEAIELIENWLKENSVQVERRSDFSQEDGTWHDLIALW